MLQQRGRAFWLMTLIAGGLVLAVALNLSDWLRGGFGWRWGYSIAPFDRILILTGVVFGYLIVIWRVQKSRLWLLFLVVIIGFCVISFGAGYVREGDAFYTMIARTISPAATAPHAVGVLLDWSGDLWRDWSELMPNLPRHVALSPPGAPMWYGFLEDMLTPHPAISQALREPIFPYQCHTYATMKYTAPEWASAWFGILMPLWAALAVLPLYAVAKSLFSEPHARRIIIGWALVPSFAMFAGSWNTLYPLIAISSFLYLHLGITHGITAGLKNRRTIRHLILSGFIAGVGSFINFAFMPMFLLFGLYALMSALWGKKPIRSSRLFFAEGVGIFFGIGMTIVWMIYWLITRETPLEILRMALNDHFALDRNYLFWVFMHVWDWVLFAGVIWALLSAYGLWHHFRTRQKGAMPPIVLLNLALWLMVIITTISNSARGETARVWSWMTPFLLLVAYDGILRLFNHPQADTTDPASLKRAWWVVHGLQAMSVILLASHLNVFTTELTAPPARPQPIADMTAIQARFTRMSDTANFDLVGWRGEYDPERNAIRLWVNWTNEQQVYDALWFGATPVSPDGVAGDMVLWQPREFFGMDMRYPTTCWSPNQAPIGDMVIIPLPENATSGDWWVSVAIFGDESQAEGRLVVNGDELQVGVGGIRVLTTP